MKHFAQKLTSNFQTAALPTTDQQFVLQTQTTVRSYPSNKHDNLMLLISFQVFCTYIMLPAIFHVGRNMS